MNKLKEKYIISDKELERLKIEFNLPLNYLEALQCLLKEEKEKEVLHQRISNLRFKVCELKNKLSVEKKLFNLMRFVKNFFVKREEV